MMSTTTFWDQTTVRFPPYRRGFHLVTDLVLQQIPQLQQVQVGFLHLFLQHTSASLSLNENADPTVRGDLETAFNHQCPDSLPFVHTYEGPDDMPAHVKSSTIGVQLNVPITDGKLNLGTWQGIYLCEHRDHPSQRRAIATVFGMPSH